MSAEPDTLGRCGRHIGRVGALAVALGVGFAVATGQGVGLARADDSAANDDAASVDSPAGESAPTASALKQPAVEMNAPPSTGGSSGSPAGESEPKQASGRMKVSSSGGANTSVNDVGQRSDTDTDTENGAGAGPGMDVGGGQPSDENGGGKGDAEGQGTTAPEPNNTPVAEIPEVSEVSTVSESTSQQKDSLLKGVVVTRSGVRAGTGAQLESVDTGAESSPPGVVTARRSVTQIEEVVTLAAGAPAPPVGVAALLRPPAPPTPVVAATVANVASSVVAILLSPFATPGPTAPAQPQLLWAVLSWVRREIDRTFFNRAPIAVADEVSTSEDVSTSIDVAGNDVDEDGHVKVTSVTQPEHGSAVVNPDGTVTYTPDAGFYGTDTFRYTISDASSRFHVHGLMGLLTGRGHTATGTVTVTVEQDNLAPVANADTAEVDEGGSVDIAVLVNDTDPNGDSTIDPASVEVTQPTHGTVTVNADGTVTYQSNGDEVTSDSFTYTVTDESGALSNTGTVTVTIAPVNDAPVAVDDTLEVNEGGTRSIRTFLNDTDAEGNSTIVGSTVEITQPEHGVATLNPNGSVTYRSTGGPASTDSFTYTVKDSSGAVSNTGTVHININHAPVAASDSITTTRDTPITIDPLVNDSDPDGDTLSLLSATINLSQGNLDLGSHTIVYTPPAGQTGVFTFTYRAWDSKFFQSSAATVTVTVIEPPD